MVRGERYILCSAIHFDDGKKHVHVPVNIKSGYVVCGRRHHDCFYTCGTLDPDLKYLKFEKEQGFVTNDNHFVTREAAAEIALASGQIKEEKIRLFSEDLY